MVNLWRSLKSVPQRSVLGAVLFLIDVEYIDDGLTCEVSKFANDTGMMNKVITSEDKRKLRSDLDCLIT